MPLRVKNIAAGFYDATGFHPIRRSVDFDPDSRHLVRHDSGSAKDNRGLKYRVVVRKGKRVRVYSGMPGLAGRKRKAPAKRKPATHRRRANPPSSSRLIVAAEQVWRGGAPAPAWFAQVWTSGYGREVWTSAPYTYATRAKALAAAKLHKRGSPAARFSGKNPNPISTKWTTARVRRTGRGDIQVMLFPKRAAAGRRRNPETIKPLTIGGRAADLWQKRDAEGRLVYAVTLRRGGARVEPQGGWLHGKALAIRAAREDYV